MNTETPLNAIPAFSFTPIARPELFQRLDAAVATPDGRALLISAPAGSGKTVLLADWLAERGRRPGHDPIVRWLTVQAGNAGATTLRPALRACLDDLTGLGDQTNSTAAQQDSAHSERPAVLVVDNAHLITDPPALAYVEYVLGQLPRSVTAILSARFAPPLRWYTMDLPGRTTRLEFADLAFSDTRTTQLCEQHGCQLTDDELAAVMELTHGWPTLVRIAAQHLSSHRDRSTALATLARNPREISDFLTTEFLAGLPEHVRRFLVDTSVPTAFTAALAARLTGLEAHQILDGLLRINFPLVHRARDGELWFGYHPVLRNHLLDEARRAADHATVHRHTAEWYLTANMPMSALPHVLAGSGPELPGFLRTAALRIVLDGDGPALFQRLEQAGSLAGDDPYLWSLRAVDALEHHDITAAIAHLDLVYECTSGNGSVAPRGWVVPLALAATVGAALATGTGLLEIQLPERIPLTGQPDIDAYVAIQVAAALVADGDIDRGEQQYHRGLALAEGCGNHHLVLRATTRLALVAGIRGVVSVLWERADRAARTAAEHHLDGCADAVQARALSAYAGYLRGVDRPDGAALATGDRFAELIECLLVFDAAEDKRSVSDRLRASTTQLLRTPQLPPAVTDLLVPHVVHALLQVHEIRTVRLLLEQAQATLGATSGVTLSRAELAAAVDRPSATLDLVAPLLEQSTPAPPHATIGWLLSANAHAGLDNPPMARAALDAALAQAAPDRLLRPFLDLPGAIELLDTHCGTFGPHNDLADSIRHHPGVRRHANGPRLTATELTVLNRLPSGRTAQQIAADLGVSVNTVKTHLRGIYAKLGTSSRADTLQLARRTGLL
ncbi:LuxR C-terminal-related transcriptional regulator [Nocardia sp. NPDC052566]|uniref:helix-turn-helix transcriptional regulator n=1 Tax=Nocardia sp. NPDC052566 TaxID=3364330 RepID=UPI0037CB2987